LLVAVNIIASDINSVVICYLLVRPTVTRSNGDWYVGSSVSPDCLAVYVLILLQFI